MPVFQLHASRYRNPASFRRALCWWSAPALRRADRRGTASRRPPRLSLGRPSTPACRAAIAGSDLTWWFGAMGLFAHAGGTTRTDPGQSARSRGAYGGNTIDFRRFAAEGITLLGRVQAARDGVRRVSPPVSPKGSRTGMPTTHIFLDMMDAHVERHGLEMPRRPGCRRACRPALPHRADADGSTFAREASTR